jgi:hypothetical protein
MELQMEYDKISRLLELRREVSQAFLELQETEGLPEDLKAVFRVETTRLVEGKDQKSFTPEELEKVGGEINKLAVIAHVLKLGKEGALTL